MRKAQEAGPTDWPTFALLQWRIAGLVLVLTLPSLITFRDSFWRIPSSLAHEVWLLGLTYLISVLVAGSTRRLEGSRDVTERALVALICFAGAGAALLLWPDLSYSRRMIVVATFLGVVVAAAPAVRSVPPRAASMILTAAAAAAISAGVVLDGRPPTSSPAGTPTESDLIFTGLHVLRMNHYEAVVPSPAATSGGLATDGDSVLFVTGDGDFYSLRLTDSLLVARALSIPAPEDRQRYLADRDLSDDRNFRVLDLIVDRSAQSLRLIAAHHHWDPEGQCVSLRVSWASPSGDGEVDGADAWTPWTPLYTTRPCLRWQSSRISNGSGGRLAQLGDGSLLFSTGTHSRDGPNESLLAQDTVTDLGKVLRIDWNGGAEIVSLGHRNPQGLLIAADGTVWSTEHGPQGGDELNRIRSGGNYGWPLTTYGTEYQLYEWPLLETTGDHGPYDEPAFVWMPSLGLSNLIEPQGSEFPRWDADLLIASMGGRSLLRARRSGDRILYVEAIPVNRGIRDLEQIGDGRILLWTDQGNFTVVQEARLDEAGARIYEECATCHEATSDQAVEAPTLRGAFRRAVGSVEGFPYSEGLRDLGGWWLAPRLDSFLLDPSAFAPGTSMVFEGLANPNDRRDLIEFLKGY